MSEERAARVGTLTGWWPWQYSRRKPKIPDDARAYFRLKRREYESIVAANPECAEHVIDALVLKDERELDWADVFTLEKVLIDIKPIVEIRRERWWWLERYRALAPKDEFDAYMNSKPPDPETGDALAVRADVNQLAASVHYILTTDTTREAIFNRFRISMLFIVLGIFLIIVVVGTSQYRDHIIASMLVLFAGYAGGVVSLQQRLQSAKDGPLLNRAFEPTSSRLSLYVVPLQGAVFAILLYLLFIAGLVKGSVFPVIQTNLPGDGCPNNNVVVELLNCTAPGDAVELAKLLAWSFIAGFLERLVPDTITRLTGQADKASSS